MITVRFSLMEASLISIMETALFQYRTSMAIYRYPLKSRGMLLMNEKNPVYPLMAFLNGN